MSTAQYAPGWYPDANLPHGSLRWWDGMQWTQHVHPAQAMPQPQQAVAAPMYGGEMAGAGKHMTAGAAQVMSGEKPSMWDANPAAMKCLIVVVLYIFITLTTGLVFLGIVPLYAAYRSFRRGEQLAPVAMVVAVAGILIGL